MTIKAPYPWFGGKSLIMPAVWNRLGDVTNFVDPFAGSMASILGRPMPFAGSETVNDLNPMIGNFWRALQRDPLRLALEADHPVEESWLHVAGDAIFYRDDWYASIGLGSVSKFRQRMDCEEEFCDWRVAGIWVAGLCQWIGDNWSAQSHSAKKDANGEPVAVTRALPHLGNGGQGVNRQLPHLGDAGMAWLDGLSFGKGLVELLSAWPSITSRTWMLFEYFAQLAERLRQVRVCCGDWQRVLGPSPTVALGLTGVFLDPPYAAEGRDSVYGEEESFAVAHDVRQWCIEHGDEPMLRIALCGYDEHDELREHGWTCLA